MKRLLLSFFILFSIIANAQVTEQDCVGAIPIHSTPYYQPYSYAGSGYIPNEINPAISCLQTGELNSVWYKLRTKTSGTLCFIINPLDIFDWYNWAIYKLNNHTCAEIAYDTTLKIACSFNDTDWWQGPSLNVQSGDLYYFCLNNFSTTQYGAMIDFSCSTAQFDTTLEQTIVGIDEHEAIIHAQIYPNPTNQNITLKLTGLKPNESYTLVLYNSAGALVKEDNLQLEQTIFDVATLPAGLYTYRIVTTAGKTAAGRFVKE